MKLCRKGIISQLKESIESYNCTIINDDIINNVRENMPKNETLLDKRHNKKGSVTFEIIRIID
jgi:hypothetical protein